MFPTLVGQVQEARHKSGLLPLNIISKLFFFKVENLVRNYEEIEFVYR